ncbi:MAG: transposase [Ignavibacteriales bacterium]|nr:MAG: transposase [Ignavibacteriales bacterium]
MSDKFLNLYRITSARANWWNYGNGIYFITTNTYNRERFFSEIINGEVKLLACGEVLKETWERLPGFFSYISIDDFVIMPDHFHGIIMINQTPGEEVIIDNQVFEPNPGYSSEKMSEIALKAGPLARVVGTFKSMVTRKARKINKQFKWQERFYDRIIRDENGLFAAREYIRMNPLKWEIDSPR